MRCSLSVGSATTVLWAGVLALIAGTAIAQPNDDLARGAFAVLKDRCFTCHGQNGIANKNIFVLDRNRLLKDKTVIPIDATSSLLRQVERGTMPLNTKTFEPERLPEAEITTLKKWIMGGAPDWTKDQPTPPKRIFLTEDSLAQMIIANIQKASERDRPYLRYFGIAHLYNANVPNEELQGYRVGLAKLLNSLSWYGEIKSFTPIDPARTILRIDLRDFKWTAAIWNNILEEYPYGIHSAAVVHVKALSGASLPYVRADWFVANASVPPLYHSILGLPDTLEELEAKLQVNVARDLDEEKNVIRGGVRKSEVSRNNRVVERHSLENRAYWRSYDFKASDGEQNIFGNPLEFKAAGGEVIFNLPNGMQAYYLANAKGNRLDVAPPEIVSDRNYPDEPVVRNGRSCMSCHYEGMKTFKDQVREVALKQPASFLDRNKVLAIYKPQVEIDDLLKRDTDRFRRAVEEAGGKLSPDFRTEPINALARKFGAELSVREAAAEAGMERQEFQLKVSKSTALIKIGFGQLLVENGAMKRDAWDSYFGDMVTELHIGTPVFPQAVIRKKAQAHFLLGRSYFFDQKKYAEAEIEYLQAIALDSTFAQPHNGLGNLRVQQKRYDDAIEEYKKAIALDPKFAFPHYNVAGLYYNQKKYVDAEVECKTAIALDAKDGGAHYLLGNIFNDQKRYVEVEVEYKQAISLVPQDHVSHIALGVLYQSQERYVEAESEYKRAIALSTKDALPHFNLGNLYADLRRPTEAEAEYKQAIDIDQTWFEPHNNLGVVYLKRKKYQDAAREFEKALRLAPDSAIARQNYDEALKAIKGD